MSNTNIGVFPGTDMTDSWVILSVTLCILKQGPGTIFFLYALECVFQREDHNVTTIPQKPPNYRQSLVCLSVLLLLL